jgi:uncharacterized membrane protein YfcA
LDIYLPIAEVSVNWPLLILLGAVVGFVSGLFGIGGGFLMAPVLVFMGIPPTVAVASQASHVVASSTSGVIRYSGQGAVDFRMGGIMALGGALGAIGGVGVQGSLLGRQFSLQLRYMHGLRSIATQEIVSAAPKNRGLALAFGLGF